MHELVLMSTGNIRARSRELIAVPSGVGIGNKCVTCWNPDQEEGKNKVGG